MCELNFRLLDGLIFSSSFYVSMLERPLQSPTGLEDGRVLLQLSLLLQLLLILFLLSSLRRPADGLLVG